MHILYLDAAGGTTNPRDRHLVLAGLSVFERGIHHLIRETDDFVESLELGSHRAIELHASHMYSGRSQPWRRLKRAERERILLEVARIVGRRNPSVRLFGVVIDKTNLKPTEDALTKAFEEVLNRFNLFLRRRKKESGEEQRGLIIMDETRHEQALQSLSHEFRVNGTRWGKLRCLAEVPLFVDSQATRLMQLADFVTYAIWRRYEHEDGRFIKPILEQFDRENRVIHGLVHYTRNRKNCYCPACASRWA